MFHSFGKIPRLNKDVVVTEKIDGSNAAVVIHGTQHPDVLDDPDKFVRVLTPSGNEYAVAAQSRTRYITPGKQTDNHGFAGWVYLWAPLLGEVLGEGIHYGEWYGNGINRGYGLGKDDKRFMLFNAKRWGDVDLSAVPGLEVATILYEGPFSTITIRRHLAKLAVSGSAHVPGYMKPEGVIVYHTAAGNMFKAFVKGDPSEQQSKGAR